MIRVDAPKVEEFEISILGPGKGEAVVVHLGANEWLTVDSCKNQRTKSHPILDYFESIGVDPASALRFVVATHAHDDHVAGISELYRAARSAKFVSTAAMTSDEFLRDIDADEDIERYLHKRVRGEFRDVMMEIEARGFLGDVSPGLHAFEQRVLFERKASAVAPYARVVCLSPSDEAISRARIEIANGLARAGERRRLATTDPNQCAIALWVEVGSAVALLGADLTIGPKGCGWSAVLATHFPSTRASYYKVPHHGSPNAHHDRVIKDLLVERPLSTIAPYRGGSNPRPNDVDLERVMSFSSEVFLTARSKMPSAPKSISTAASALMGVATNVREIHGTPGHVQSRFSNGHWQTAFSPPAYRA